MVPYVHVRDVSLSMRRNVPSTYEFSGQPAHDKNNRITHPANDLKENTDVIRCVNAIERVT